MSGDLVERALAASRADGCAVLVQAQGTASLRFAGNGLTTNGVGRDRRVSVVSVVGESTGVRSASRVVDDDALRALVRDSETAAREAPAARDAGPLVAGDADDDFDDGAPDVPPGLFTPLAADLGAAFAECRRGGVDLYGFASHGVTTTWLGLSTGLRRRHVQPRGYLELTAKEPATGGSTWHGQHTRDWTDVTVGGPVLQGLRQRLAWSRRTVDVEPGRHEALLPPSAVADLMVQLYWAAGGRDAAEGSSVFSRPGGGTRVGERLGPPGLSLRSDPHAPGLRTTPFVVATSSSAETSVVDLGLPLVATEWLRDGHLASLVHTRASARETGEQVAPYVDNLQLDGGGTASLEDMVARTERGLLLTCLWYIRTVDPETLLVTGLTRDGVHLVRDGEVVGAVGNFRFNESPVDLLGRLSEVGATAPCLPREASDWFTWTAMPALRVPDFHLSSRSAAT